MTRPAQYHRTWRYRSKPAHHPGLSVLRPPPRRAGPRTQSNASLLKAEHLVHNPSVGVTMLAKDGGDMDVRVFGIVMRYRNPLQSCVQIFLHFAHKIAGQSVQVDPFAEFRRNDHFPEPRVACLLPAIKDLRRRNDFALVAKGAGIAALHCTVAGDVATVCAPLAGGPVWRVHHANRASLVELPPPSTRSAVGTALLSAPGASGVANNRPHTGRPGKRFVFAGRSGSPGPNPELPLAFSFRGHGLTTLPWRLGNRPPLPCLRS